MENKRLNSGAEMPPIGFGVFQIQDLRVCQQAVEDAIDVGYRLLDTAAVYGNESAVGAAVQASAVPRKELFLTTKLWVQDAGYDQTKRAVETSLKNLKTSYLDLLLIHRPFGDYYGAWRAMEELYDEGVLRSIGVSNFESARLIDLVMNNRTTPAVCQVECHPFFQQSDAIGIMQEYGIQPEGWAPFAEGKHGIFTLPLLSEIGEKYGKSAAQVILRWNTQRGVVVIPKSIHRNRMEQNIDIFDFILTEEEMASIAALDRGETLFGRNSDPNYAKMINGVKIH